MSKKHNQRTRAEILAKRGQRIHEVRVMKKILHPVPMMVPQSTDSERLRAAFDASKYMPHIGAKEQERAKRCDMETHFPPFGEVVRPGFRTQFPRSAPVVQQMSKTDYEAYLEAREQEYESVF